MIDPPRLHFLKTKSVPNEKGSKGDETFLQRFNPAKVFPFFSAVI
mgnify:CR=1 FL=1|jgi:hypothetical protein